MTDGTGTGQGGPTAYGGEPDWVALAERHERDTRRRKRIRVIAAVAAATAAIGAITTTAVLVSGSGSGHRGDRTSTVIDGLDHPSPTALASDSPTAPGSPSAPGSPAASSSASASAATSAAASADASTGAGSSGSASRSPAAGSAHPGTAASPQPAPAGAPPAPGPAPAPAPAAKDPLTLISDVHTDGAPLDPGSLFPAASLAVNGKTWTRIALDSVTPCWKATTGGLGDVISGQPDCQTMLRATYANGDSAVTIGVAVFNTKTQADAAQAAYKGQIQGLVTADSISFCTSAGCASSHGEIGRYGYYSVSGTLKPGGTQQDAAATAAGPGLADYARTRLLARGQAAAG